MQTLFIYSIMDDDGDVTDEVSNLVKSVELLRVLTTYSFGLMMIISVLSTLSISNLHQSGLMYL